jgi:hypothetical protein
MNRLFELHNVGLAVKWTTVVIGWDGPGKYERILDPIDVISFAESRFANGDESPSIVSLISLESKNVSELEQIIRKLAREESANRSLEERKWRALLLKDALKDLPEDPVSGLIALTCFWEKFDFPEDSPHIVQGKINEISPADYYTEKMFRYLLEQHQDWLDKELIFLKQESLIGRDRRRNRACHWDTAHTNLGSQHHLGWVEVLE